MAQTLYNLNKTATRDRDGSQLKKWAQSNRTILNSVNISDEYPMVESLAGLFDNCPNLTSVNLNGIKADKLTNVANLCNNCEKLTSFANVYWSNVENMAYAFSGCRNLATAPDLGYIFAKNAAYAFQYTKINTLPPGFNSLQWSQMPGSLQGIFFYTNLKNVNLNGWNSRSNDMSSMFSYCYNLEEARFTNSMWNNVTNISQMVSRCGKMHSVVYNNVSMPNLGAYSLVNLFHNCANLTYCYFNVNISNVQDYSGLFWNAWNIVTVDCFGTSAPQNVVYADRIFQNCQKLNYVHNIHRWYAPRLSNLFCGFYDCFNLKTLNIGNWQPNQCSNYGFAFSNCINLSSLNLNGWQFNGATTNMTGMFENCYNLSMNNFEGWNLTTVNNTSEMFANCNLLGNTWVYMNATTHGKMNSCTNMYGMFTNCKKIAVLWATDWNTKKVTNAANMFAGCNLLQAIYPNNWNLCNCTNIANMFAGCNVIQVDSLDRIANVFKTATNVTYKNFSNLNTYSPFYGTSINFYSQLNSSQISALQSNGWSF